ncbi:hypothetical protein HK096_009193 [Nowakowskiella sp. JEL0078]|nr:hypothetical protein HK096_009193 [Nowakowskiella sp. JEL0078]
MVRFEKEELVKELKKVVGKKIKSDLVHSNEKSLSHELLCLLDLANELSSPFSREWALRLIPFLQSLVSANSQIGVASTQEKYLLRRPLEFIVEFESEISNLQDSTLSPLLSKFFDKWKLRDSSIFDHSKNFVFLSESEEFDIYISLKEMITKPSHSALFQVLQFKQNAFYFNMEFPDGVKVIADFVQNEQKNEETGSEIGRIKPLPLLSDQTHYNQLLERIKARYDKFQTENSTLVWVIFKEFLTLLQEFENSMKLSDPNDLNSVSLESKINKFNKDFILFDKLWSMNSDKFKKAGSGKKNTITCEEIDSLFLDYQSTYITHATDFFKMIIEPYTKGMQKKFVSLTLRLKNLLINSETRLKSLITESLEFNEADTQFFKLNSAKIYSEALEFLDFLMMPSVENWSNTVLSECLTQLLSLKQKSETLSKRYLDESSPNPSGRLEKINNREFKKTIKENDNELQKFLGTASIWIKTTARIDQFTTLQTSTKSSTLLFPIDSLWKIVVTSIKAFLFEGEIAEFISLRNFFSTITNDESPESFSKLSIMRIKLQNQLKFELSEGWKELLLSISKILIHEALSFYSRKASENMERQLLNTDNEQLTKKKKKPVTINKIINEIPKEETQDEENLMEKKKPKKKKKSKILAENATENTDAENLPEIHLPLKNISRNSSEESSEKTQIPEIAISTTKFSVQEPTEKPQVLEIAQSVLEITDLSFKESSEKSQIPHFTQSVSEITHLSDQEFIENPQILDIAQPVSEITHLIDQEFIEIPQNLDIVQPVSEITYLSDQEFIENPQILDIAQPVSEITHLTDQESTKTQNLQISESPQPTPLVKRIWRSKPPKKLEHETKGLEPNSSVQTDASQTVEHNDVPGSLLNIELQSIALLQTLSSQSINDITLVTSVLELSEQISSGPLKEKMQFEVIKRLLNFSQLQQHEIISLRKELEDLKSLNASKSKFASINGENRNGTFQEHQELNRTRNKQYLPKFSQSRCANCGELGHKSSECEAGCRYCKSSHHLSDACPWNE